MDNYTHDDYKELEKGVKVVTKRFRDIQWMEEREMKIEIEIDDLIGYQFKSG